MRLAQGQILSLVANRSYYFGQDAAGQERYEIAKSHEGIASNAKARY
jgi:hypothetical protein